jgi:glutathione peroxidase
VNGGEVTWNFNKFLVDPSGKVVAHLDSSVEPTSAELKKKIESVLPRK